MCVCVCECVCMCVSEQNDVQAAKYKCIVCPIQVGSRGYIDIDSFSPMKERLKFNSPTYRNLLTSLSSVSLTQSYCIWKSRDNVHS